MDSSGFPESSKNRVGPYDWEAEGELGAKKARLKPKRATQLSVAKSMRSESKFAPRSYRGLLRHHTFDRYERWQFARWVDANFSRLNFVVIMLFLAPGLSLVVLGFVVVIHNWGRERYGDLLHAANCILGGVALSGFGVSLYVLVRLLVWSYDAKALRTYGPSGGITKR